MGPRSEQVSTVRLLSTNHAWTCWHQHGIGGWKAVLHTVHIYEVDEVIPFRGGRLGGGARSIATSVLPLAAQPVLIQTACGGSIVWIAMSLCD